MTAEIKPVTALRGYAAFWVLLFHYFVAYRNLIYIKNLQLTRAQAFIAPVSRGYLGVDIFFLISGFIIAYVYFPFFREHGLRLRTFAAFILRRLARIYPLHLCTLLTLVAFDALHLGIVNIASHQTLYANVLLIQDWGFLKKWTWNGPSWSISVEWALYLVWPLIFWLFGRNARVSAALVKLLLLYLMLLCMAKYLNRGTLDHPLEYGLLRGFLEFSMGVCLHQLYRQGFLKTLPWNSINATVLGAIALGLCFGMRDMTLLALFVLLVYSLLYIRGTGARLFDNKAMLFVGEISYSLYLWHMPALLFYRRFYALFSQLFPVSEHSEMPELGAMTLFIAGVIALSYISYRYIEKPARDAINRWQNRVVPLQSAS